MSWSTSARGTIDHVRTCVVASLEASAKTYDEYGTPEGKEEAQDCRDAKRAVLSALSTMTLTPDSYAGHGYEASVSAYGSRSQGTVTMHVEVTKTPKSEP